MSFKGERKSNERRKPSVPSPGFQPCQDGIPGIVLAFQVLERPSGHVPTLSWTVTFASLQDGETTFQSTTPGEAAGTCQLALAL